MDMAVSAIDQVAGLAVAKMNEIGIPPTPNNYAVWYNYFADSYPDLTRAIDRSLAAKEPITAQKCEELFEQFFTFVREGATLNNAIQKIEAVIGNAAEYLGKAGKDAAQIGDALSLATGTFEASSSTTAPMSEIIEAILSATKGMEAHTRKLEQRLAASTAEILELRQEVETFRQEATLDALTGIANRKHFDMALRREIDVAAAGGDLCLLMLDVDHFKNFNDKHGHQTGDQVLNLVVHTMKACVRNADTAARYGGDEFAVIMPDISLKDAAATANRIRESLAAKSVVKRGTGERLGKVTLSIGVSKLASSEGAGDLLARADAALYQAKSKGRNCVVPQSELAMA